MKKSLLMIICTTVIVAFMYMLSPTRSQAEPPYYYPGRPHIEAGVEHHPHLHRVIEELEGARHEIMESGHDFGGHKEEAVRALDAAITQLRLAIQYDRR